MNAPARLDLGPGAAPGKPGASLPLAPVPLTVRDQRFGREAPMARHWLGGDMVASAWFNALSLTFPRGEAMFIDAVKAHREGVDPVLAEQIRDFVRQEVNHSREHLAFNRAVAGAGYDTAAIDARVVELIGMTRAQPAIVQLAITCALEHFTAMFAHEFLAHPQHFGGTEGELTELWRWHAVEEIEHKAVAYDTWLHATRDWRPLKRWWVRSLVMVDVTCRFLANRMRDATDLLAQDGMGKWQARRGLLAYLLVRPGILRRVAPAWAAWFRPGFHPWQIDDSDLIAAHAAQIA